MYPDHSLLVESQELAADENKNDNSFCNYINVASWNIAAVYNNPFEYWVSHQNPEYDYLMKGVQDFIDTGGKELKINQVFTDEMFQELKRELFANDIQHLEDLEMAWRLDYMNRKVVSEFLSDKSIGNKRLISMPDRITNTINLQDGGVCNRPTAINAYSTGCLSSTDEWWRQWKQFMFHQYVCISDGDGVSSTQPELVCNLIGPLQRSKYPAVTVEEQAMSVGLQILCLAILDAVLVYVLNSVAPNTWEDLRKELCDALIKNKAHKISRIIATMYCDQDVFFIQEAAAIFVRQAMEQPEISARYILLSPFNLDGKRDQNSLILASRARFREASRRDVTQAVLDALESTWVAPGDLLVVSIEDARRRPHLLVSFHGDGNGLSTQPVLRAVLALARRREYAAHALLMGVDANTHSAARDAFHHTVEGFGAFLREARLVSVWGDRPDPAVRTTCASRTYLQTQLSKSTPMRRRRSLSHQNLQDWIVARCPPDGEGRGGFEAGCGERCEGEAAGRGEEHSGVEGEGGRW